MFFVFSSLGFLIQFWIESFLADVQAVQRFYSAADFYILNLLRWIEFAATFDFPGRFTRWTFAERIEFIFAKTNCLTQPLEMFGTLHQVWIELNSKQGLSRRVDFFGLHFY